jgi:1,4-alpha-glucan branching enzyme
MKNIITSREEPAIAVRLEFNDENAKTVCIAGSFNDWNPKTTSMLKDGAGHWIQELALPPGIYEYLYVVDGRWVNDPKAVKSTPNPQGGRNSVLVVEQTSMNNPTNIR